MNSPDSVFSSVADVFQNRVADVVKVLGLEMEFNGGSIRAEQRISVYSGVQFDEYKVFVDIYTVSMNQSRVFSLNHDCVERLWNEYGNDLRIYGSRRGISGFSVLVGLFYYDHGPGRTNLENSHGTAE